MSKVDKSKTSNNKSKNLEKRKVVSQTSQRLAMSKEGSENKTLNENIFNQKDNNIEAYNRKKINHLYRVVSLIQNNYKYTKGNRHLEKTITLLEIMEVTLNRLELDKYAMDKNLYQKEYDDIIEKNLPEIRKYLKETQISLLMIEQLDRELTIMFYEAGIITANIAKIGGGVAVAVFLAPAVIVGVGATGAVAATIGAGMIGVNAGLQELGTQKGKKMIGVRKEYDAWKITNIVTKTFIEAFLVGGVLKAVIPPNTSQPIIAEVAKRLCVNILFRDAIITLLNLNRSDPYHKQMDKLIKDKSINGMVLTVFQIVVKAK
jgi:hypothetical protein